MNIVTLPKTIDNDVAMTDVTFGFDTAMSTAAEAIDRLHTTADSHHRVIIVEIMGHSVGWLTLGAGIAGGADVILLPEIPYHVDHIIESLLERYRKGKRFSIVAIAEGAHSADDAGSGEDQGAVPSSGVRLAGQIHALSNLDVRVTVLGHLQRGGSPTPADRLLATRLGTYCAGADRRGRIGADGRRARRLLRVRALERGGRQDKVRADRSLLDSECSAAGDLFWRWGHGPGAVIAGSILTHHEWNARLLTDTTACPFSIKVGWVLCMSDSKGFATGKLPLEYMQTLLTRYSSCDERLIAGPCVGEDVAVIDMGDRYMVVKTDSDHLCQRPDRLVCGPRQCQ